MTRRLTFLLLCLALIGVLAVAAVSQPDRHDGDDTAVAAPSAAIGGDESSAEAGLPGWSVGAERLDAVRTVKLFCDLVGSRRLWGAAALFATPRLWSRRELRAVRRLDFRAARVDLAPDPHTLVVVARVRASGTSESPVRADDTTLFFTLGRVGTEAGGWLITAVTASP